MVMEENIYKSNYMYNGGSHSLQNMSIFTQNEELEFYVNFTFYEFDIKFLWFFCVCVYAVLLKTCTYHETQMKFMKGTTARLTLIHTYMIQTYFWIPLVLSWFLYSSSSPGPVHLKC